MPDFEINGYTISSQRAYDVLNKYNSNADKILAKLDKNSDKIISEDEFVELSDELVDDLDDADGDSSDSSEDDYIKKTMQQISFYEDQNSRLRQQIFQVSDDLAKAKDPDATSSLISSLNSLQSQVDSNYKQIYSLLVSREEYESKLNAANSASTTSSFGTTAAANAGASAGTSYTATGEIGNTPSKGANYALQYDGKGASEMQKIMKEAGCNFHSGAWCADFVTFATKMGNGGTAPHQFLETCSNTAGCISISNWASSKGLYTTDLSQVQPGDFVLYGSKGNEHHIGIVTAVNSDGTVDTIEGNTSDDNGNYTNGVVNQHHHVSRFSGFVIMH